MKIITILISIVLCTLLSIGCNRYNKAPKEDYDNSVHAINTSNNNSNKDSKDYDNKTLTENNIKEKDDIVAIIYIADSEAENLLDKEVILNELSAKSIFSQLKSNDVISKDTKLNRFKISKSKNGQITGIIDFSEEFYEFNLGSSYEMMMLDSIAKTYIKNFNLDKFKIQVAGENYESGHILLEDNDYFTLDSFK